MFGLFRSNSASDLQGMSSERPSMFGIFRTRSSGNVLDAERRPDAAANNRPRQAYLQRLGIQEGTTSSAMATAPRTPLAEIRPAVEWEPLDEEWSATKNMGEVEGEAEGEGSSEGDSEELMSRPNSAPTSPAGGAGRDFRHRFLQKLAYERVWVPQAHRSPKHQSVIIFDWDDTLLCTSWLTEHDHELRSGKVDAPLDELGSCVKSMLENAVRLGRTYIITNASTGWVEYSAAKWIPEVLPILRKIPVISARDKFQPAFPDKVEQWKIEAFLAVQRQLDNTPITNLVALGDADFEMEAARIMGGEFEEGLIKTVKFRPRPLPRELLQEVEVVMGRFELIVQAARSLRVFLGQKEPKTGV